MNQQSVSVHESTVSVCARTNMLVDFKSKMLTNFPASVMHSNMFIILTGNVLVQADIIEYIHAQQSNWLKSTALFPYLIIMLMTLLFYLLHGFMMAKFRPPGC